jgi:hypothetical protein
MTYRYSFDEGPAGDLRLSQNNYRTLQIAFKLLREELELWNKRTREHGAPSAPYEKEVADLKQLIQWGNGELRQDPIEVIVRGISIGNLRYVKAALMFLINRQEEDCTKKLDEGWPEAAVRSLRDGVNRTEKIAVEIECEPSDILGEVVRKRDPPGTPKDRTARAVQWDLFISHASEDKDDFARPLADALKAKGFKVWFDDFTLKMGDSLRRSIDLGLARSRFGVVVISPNFLRKEWPQKELDGLVAREVNGVKVILPVWHKITADELRAHSPTLADRFAASSEKGLDSVVAEIARVIRPEEEEGNTQTGDGSLRRAENPRVIEDLWVNTEYPQKLGLIQKLTAEG